MPLRCFVAMALARTDTDRLYQKVIAPTLRKERITAVRVDRREHNEDINTRTMSLLAQCNLAIADLTYARPSVYFEAGFAQRSVPVIYTCREDHLSPDPKDKFGNSRVHIDLLMKNIIWWSPSEYKKFAERLARRLRYTVAPLIRTAIKELAGKEDAGKFAGLSLQEKKERILRLWERHLKRAGYLGYRAERHTLAQHWWPPSPPSHDFNYRYELRGKIDTLSRMTALIPGWVGTRFAEGVLYVVLVHVTPNLTKSGLDTIHRRLLRMASYDIALRPKAILQLSENIFICSLQRVPPRRIAEALRKFSLSDGEYVFHGSEDVPQIDMPKGLELFALGHAFSRSDGPAFLVRNPRKMTQSHRLREVSSVDATAIAEIVEDLDVRAVPRSVHVRVIDDFKSEKALAILMARCIQEIEFERRSSRTKRQAKFSD